MSVKITPDILKFNAPYTEQQKITELSIFNDSEETIAFKVKTTTPQKYCVKPNSAVLPAKSNQIVQIVYLGNDNELLQAHDPKVPYLCKDKFLVQTLPCPYEFEDIHKGWSSLESEFKGLLEAKKIRVKFDFAEAPAASTKEDKPKQEKKEQEQTAVTEKETDEKEEINTTSISEKEIANLAASKKESDSENEVSEEVIENENDDIVAEIIAEKQAEEKLPKEEKATKEEELPKETTTQETRQGGIDFAIIAVIIAVLVVVYLEYNKKK